MLERNKFRFPVGPTGPGETERMIRHLEAKAERILQDKVKLREFVDDLPFGPAAEPKEVANVVTFMASDRASYVSGAAAGRSRIFPWDFRDSSRRWASATSSKGNTRSIVTSSFPDRRYSRTALARSVYSFRDKM